MNSDGFREVFQAVQTNRSTDRRPCFSSSDPFMIHHHHLFPISVCSIFICVAVTNQGIEDDISTLYQGLVKDAKKTESATRKSRIARHFWLRNFVHSRLLQFN